MDSPIFVVGSMRSGSTLLRLVLDSHDRIAIGHETGFMGAVAATVQIPGWLHGKDWYVRLGWSREELDERIADFYGGIFGRYAEQQGKARWGDKTPFHTYHMPQMAQTFPTSVFVGIVRHPGAVATSLRDKFHYRWTDALDYWQAVNLEMVRRGADLGSRFTLLRYEDLVSEPERLTRELMAFLGEDWTPRLVEHHRVQRDQGAPRTVEGNTDSQAPISTDAAHRWRDSVSSSETDELQARVGSLTDFFGYQPQVSSGAEPGSLATQSALLVGGEVLRTRCTDWGDRIDFADRRVVVAPDADLQELAERAARAEAALARVRSRRAVRLSEALRRTRKDRDLASLRQVWRAARGRS